MSTSAGRDEKGVSGAVEVDSSPARRTVPVRTCVGCRVCTAKAELLRVVAIGNDLVPDRLGRRPGRGAHIHPDPGCLDLAERRRAFARALRLPGPLETGAVRAEIVGQQPSGADVRVSDANAESRSSEAMNAR